MCNADCAATPTPRLPTWAAPAHEIAELVTVPLPNPAFAAQLIDVQTTAPPPLAEK
jgi:hypothetical protein